MSGLVSSVLDSFFKREYSILKNGRELLSFQTFVSLDSSFDANTVTQPVEQGAFFSANKTASPASYSVELTLQGTDLEIMQAIAVLEAEVKDASLIQILTPFYVTPNVTVVKMAWVHKESVGILAVSLQLQEIKEVTAEYTNTEVKPVSKGQAKNGSDVSTQNGGKVQPKKPRQSVLTQMGL